MTDELKPCPFCPDGGKPDVRIDVMRGVINRDEYIPWCERCGIEYTGEKGYFDSKGEAADAWNTRYIEKSNKPYYQEVYEWAFSNMEGCDEPEYSMFVTICDAIARYKREVESND